MILPKNKYRAFGYFAMAIFYYVAFAFQLLAGVIPRGSGDPAKYYRENTGFFWTYILILFLVFLYQATRGIYLYRKRLRHDTDPVPQTKSFTPRTASIITLAVLMPVGLCFLILPLVELIKQTVYGGTVFGTHALKSEPALFWTVLVFQLVIGLAPIVAGVMLLIFPPRHVDPVPETVPAVTADSAKPGMKTITKVLLGAGAAVLLIGFVAVAGLVGGTYYLFKKIDDPALVQKRQAADVSGAEFGKTTDQSGCMEKAYSLPVPDSSFDMSNHHFTKACLKASRATPQFCDGVPLMLKRDWFTDECKAVGHNTDACIDAFTVKRDFCRLDGDS
jgi:hypothetical protein